MLSLLPDLTPRDSHSLWYTSSRNPSQFPPHLDQSHSHTENGSSAGNAVHAPGQAGTGPRARGGASSSAVERSALARLRADEANMERRRLNVSNFGATWLKPPGVVKSLFQMREERREQEEHAEAMRREQLAQELAEAEAEAAATAAAALDGEDGPMMMMGGDLDGEPMDEDMAGAGRDLDDDIPDADEGGFGFDSASDDDEDEDSEDDEDGDEDDDGDGDDAVDDGGGGIGAARRRRAQQRELANRMATVRAAEDRARERMVRGQDVGSDMYGGEDDLDEEDQAHMLEEDDLIHLSHQHEVESGMDMDMDANLDDDVPDAESAGYEHTDTEAELSSSDDGNNASFVVTRAPLGSRSRGSLIRSDGTRTSLDINSILSRDGSSAMGSSPHVRRRN